MILFNYLWYTCKFNERQPIIGDPFVLVHDYDILNSDGQPIKGEAWHLSEEKSDSSKSDIDSDKLDQNLITQQVNQQIKNSPLNASQIPLPPHTTMQHPIFLQPTMTTTATNTSTTTATPATISAAYQKALNHQAPSGWGGAVEEVVEKEEEEEAVEEPLNRMLPQSMTSNQWENSKKYSLATEHEQMTSQKK